ncbi:MAG: PTPA-CTERM sorting domain-containing protein [Oscillatoriales cyanobacterium C42_A2020_001]|nr:PTPA-CTERM sorting domain-containing protein [Leptolyngbyaceae cyanobacterium C42_A2020_001]
MVLVKAVGGSSENAVGGAFFPTNTPGAVIPGSITVTLSDGTTQTLTNTNSSSFIGFIADPGSVFTSLSIASVNPELEVYPTVNDLLIGTAIPTPALLPGLISMGMAVWRKRKAELASDREA